MSYTAYFDSPTNYSSKFDFYTIGASPFLLEKLLEILDDKDDTIEEIKIGLYLFNNEILNQKLIALAKAGVKIDVITIPLDGYDATSPKRIINLKTREIESTATKFSLARNIFKQHYKNEVPNYTLYFFPHIYLRSENVKNFARGEMPYSLHIKSFLIKYKNKIGTVGLSSSNFAVRDLVKEENLLIIKNEVNYFNPTYHFFDDLIKSAIPIHNFDFKKDYSNYEVETTEQPVSNCCNFIAPFYFNAAFKAEAAILNLINDARLSIKVVAQHICPVSYTINGKFHSEFENKEFFREGLLKTIIEKAKAGVKVEFISQTFASSENKLGSNFRTPLNKASFIEFFKAITNVPNISYYVNENIHSKYMIVDDKVFVSSFNYTPTQFIYLDKVDIKTFKNDPGKSYQGIYSETGHYCIIDDLGLAKEYKKNFDGLLTKNETTIIQQS